MSQEKVSQRPEFTFDLEDDVESSLEYFFENFGERVYDSSMESLKEDLVASVSDRVGEVEQDINAGLARPEFEKAVEDAMDRLKLALKEAFTYRKAR